MCFRRDHKWKESQDKVSKDNKEVKDKKQTKADDRQRLKAEIKKKRQKKQSKLTKKNDRRKAEDRKKIDNKKDISVQATSKQEISKQEQPCKKGSAWSREQKKFLLKQLIHRDFKSRYKRAVLGVLWSMLSPLLFFAAQAIVFSFLFDRGEHYISYLITGNIVYHYFTDATTNSMFSLQSNGGIISKIKVDKQIFLFSRSISCLINFVLTLIIMFSIVAIDKMPFHWDFFLLIFPIACMFFLNMGLGYILSAMFVFFKDTQYLYNLFTRILLYFSAIFYRLDRFPDNFQQLFFINPVYCYIYYFRSIIIDNTIPSLFVHGLCIGFPIVFMLIGKLVYKLNDNRFAYYF